MSMPYNKTVFHEGKAMLSGSDSFSRFCYNEVVV